MLFKFLFFGSCAQGDHPECPERISSIFEKLESAGYYPIFFRICKRMKVERERQRALLLCVCVCVVRSYLLSNLRGMILSFVLCRRLPVRSVLYVSRYPYGSVRHSCRCVYTLVIRLVAQCERVPVRAATATEVNCLSPW